jgi:RNA polymerase sigma-70 factor (ECF subfamily)
MADNDVSLLKAMHDEHGAALWSFCLRLTGGDRQRAEDIVQDTMLRAWRHPESMDESRGSVRGWLFTVARHIFIDQVRSRRSHPEVVTAAPPERPGADSTDQLLLTWVVADALSTLSPDHRAVLVECYYRGRPVAEAAERLGVPTGTVKSRAHYALKALRLALEEQGVVA